MRVAVIGLGLIGGSLALAARARGYDRDATVRERARARGIDVTDSPQACVAGADVVVAAVPPDALAAALASAARAVPQAVLTDVASSKRDLDALAAALPEGARFVGGHPMAGSTGRGILAADGALFRHRPWIVVPTARSDAAAVGAVGDLARGVGARPVVLSLARHEALMTWATQLPLVVAAALMRAAARGAGAGLAQVAGPGFADTTRLAGSPAALAAELALADPPALARALDAVVAELAALAEALRGGAASRVLAILAEAEAARAQFERVSDDNTAK